MEATSSFTLPAFLVQRMLRGEVILFLGAGASLGSRNSQGQDPPLGGKLAQLLADACGLPLAPTDTLQFATSVAYSKLGQEGVWSLLRKHYLKCTPSAALKVLARYYWPRIYTTNIDDATERAFDTVGINKPDVLIHKSSVSFAPPHPDMVQVIKLNGSVDRLESGIIFTPDEYADYLDRTDLWYHRLVQDYYDKTFVFIGTQLNEPIFQHHLRRKERESGSSPGESFIICPSFTPQQQEYYRSKRLVPLPGTLQMFSEALPAVLGQRMTLDEVSQHQNPALFAVLSSPAVRSALAACGGDAASLQIVTRGYLEQVSAREPSAIRPFYFGQRPSWRDILDGVPARLKIVQTLKDVISTHSGHALLISGPAGTGKSTCTMMAALELADEGSRTVIWVDGSIGFPKDVITTLAQESGPKTIFVDNFSRHTDTIRMLIANRLLSGSNTTLVLCDRSVLAERNQSLVRIPHEQHVSIRKIDHGDVEPILSKIQQYGPWAYLRRLSEIERKELLWQKSKKELLVALREATSGQLYDNIIASEYGNISTGVPRTVCALASLASMHSIPISRATLTGALVGFYEGTSPSPDEGVRDIVVEEHGLYRMRHAMIAEFLIRRIIPRAESLEGVRSLLLSLSRFSSPLRKHARAVERNLFVAIINHEFLWDLYRNEKNRVLGVFREAERWFSEESLFWMQYALFEQKLSMLSEAMSHIRLAHSLWPESFQVIHAYAGIHFDSALRAPSAERGLQLMEDASALLEVQIRDSQNEAFAITGLCIGRMKVLSKWLPERARQEKTVLHRRLREAQKKFPGNAELRRAVRDFELSYIGERISRR